MKNLNEQAVLDAAKQLIADNGSTTTLDIKNVLRNQGYFATQNQVSAIMFNNYRSAGLEFSVAGNHREYVEGQISSTVSHVNDEKAEAIALCEANGLVYASNPKQKKNETLYFTDPLVPKEAYSITKKGYARRHMIGGGYCGTDAMYQLNKKITTTHTGKWGTYQSIERVLLPGKYLQLAEMVIRIAKRHRP